MEAQALKIREVLYVAAIVSFLTSRAPMFACSGMGSSHAAQEPSGNSETPCLDAAVAHACRFMSLALLT